MQYGDVHAGEEAAQKVGDGAIIPMAEYQKQKERDNVFQHFSLSLMALGRIQMGGREFLLISILQADQVHFKVLPVLLHRVLQLQPGEQ